jgi:hypothetical protein
MSPPGYDIAALRRDRVAIGDATGVNFVLNHPLCEERHRVRRQALERRAAP